MEQAFSLCGPSMDSQNLSEKPSIPKTSQQASTTIQLELVFLKNCSLIHSAPLVTLKPASANCQTTPSQLILNRLNSISSQLPHIQSFTTPPHYWTHNSSSTQQQLAHLAKPIYFPIIVFYWLHTFLFPLVPSALHYCMASITD